MAHQTSSVESSTSWLAIDFGCCASSRRKNSDGDDERAALQTTEASAMQICYEQPQTVPLPRVDPIHPRPTTSHSMGRHVSQWFASSRDLATRASSKASIHTLSKPRQSHSKSRPSIGRPTDLRHCDGLNGVDGVQDMLDNAPMPIRRRRSFRPLELSIYFPDGRLSPLPDFADTRWEKQPAELEIPVQALVRERDSRTNSISSNPSTSSYLIQRKPLGSESRRSSLQSQHSVQLRPLSGTMPMLPFLLEEPKSYLNSVAGKPQLQRANTHGTLSPNRVLHRLPSTSSSRSRASTAPSRPASLRKTKTDVDEAIRELETIVENRRADAYRTTNQAPCYINRLPLSPSHHVPAIAPSLRMHVRSETLSDIGSAFSVPLAHKPLPTLPPPPGPSCVSHPTTKLVLSPKTRSFTGPLTSNPITPSTPTMPRPTTPIHRLGLWLKRSLPTTPSSPSFLKSSPSTPKQQSIQPLPQSQSPFYQCEKPASTTSRPSTSSSHTLANTHSRHRSAETATVTLVSSSSLSYPSTPALSLRSLSPEPVSAPATPARMTILKNHGRKTRRVPAPLNLAREKEMCIEAALGSARSVASSLSTGSGRLRLSGACLKPPPSPHYGILRGMELSARNEQVVLGTPIGPVGVAF